MTDQDPQLPPEREAEIRRLLAESRATEPMPADVAERLDGVLADLGAERGQAPPTPAVSSLEARRRRNAASLVLAAAVVVVASIGVGQYLRGSGSSDEAGADAFSSAEGDAGGQAEGPEALKEDGAADTNSLRAAAAPPPDLPIARISRSGFAADAERLRAALTQQRKSGFVELDVASLPARLLARRSSLACGGAPWGRGGLVPVVFEGQSAVLAFRPPAGDTQVIDVLQCGSGQTLHSTTLPAR